MWLDSGHGSDGGTAGRPFVPVKSDRERSSEIKRFRRLVFETSNTTIAAHATTTIIPTTSGGLELHKKQMKRVLEVGRTGQQQQLASGEAKGASQIPCMPTEPNPKEVY